MRALTAATSARNVAPGPDAPGGRDAGEHRVADERRRARHRPVQVRVHLRLPEQRAGRRVDAEQERRLVRADDEHVAVERRARAGEVAGEAGVGGDRVRPDHGAGVGVELPDGAAEVAEVDGAARDRRRAGDVAGRRRDPLERELADVRGRDVVLEGLRPAVAPGRSRTSSSLPRGRRPLPARTPPRTRRSAPGARDAASSPHQRRILRHASRFDQPPEEGGGEHQAARHGRRLYPSVSLTLSPGPL